jgi:hypothetical protein
MKIVGLTGGIATGKSLATTAFRRSGVPVIDCDEIARAVTDKVSDACEVHSGKTGDSVASGLGLIRECPLQNRWGYRRVLKAFGTEILTENGDPSARTGNALVRAFRNTQLSCCFTPLTFFVSLQVI